MTEPRTANGCTQKERTENPKPELKYVDVRNSNAFREGYLYIQESKRETHLLGSSN